MSAISPTVPSISLACSVCGIPAIVGLHHEHIGVVFHSNCCTNERCLTLAAA